MGQVIEPLNNHIDLVRGDYLEIFLNVNVGTNLTPINLNFKDINYRDYKVYFGLMEPNQPFESSIMHKEYLIDDSFVAEDSNFTEDGGLIIRVFTQDTICLHPGEYFYSIKLEEPNNHQISTVVNKCVFNIL